MAFVLPIANVPLSPTYRNAIRFTSATQINNFLALYSTFYSSTGSGTQYTEINFEFRDGIETIVNVPIKADGSTTAQSRIPFYLGCNYLHVIDDTQTSSEQKPFFYFIKKARMVSAEVVEYSVELDVFTTYVKDVVIDQPILTERKHCNRFYKRTEAGSDYFYFRPDEVILGDELDNQFKALIPKTIRKTSINYFDEQSTFIDTPTRSAVNTALNDTLWLYAFITPPEEDPVGSSIANEDQNVGGRFDTGVRVLFAPFKKMYLRNTGLTTPVNVEWDADTLARMVNGNTTLNARVLSLRVSPVSPFNNRFNFFDDPDSTIDFVSGVLRINYRGTSAGNNHSDVFFPNIPMTTTNRKRNLRLVRTGFGSTSSTWGDNINAMLGLQFYSSLAINDIGELGELVSTDNLITDLPRILSTSAPTNTTDKSASYEPKLFSLPYKRLEMMTSYSSPRELNEIYFSKSSTRNNMRFQVSDMPSVLAQKYSYQVDTTLDNIYYPNMLRTNNALVGNNIYELPIRSDQFANYVANHSNYLITGLALPLAQSGIGIATSLATGNKVGAIAQGTGAVVDAISFGLKMDDLDRAPDSVRATGNDFIHDYADHYDFFGLKVIAYELTDEQKKMAFDYFYRYGYRINRECFWDVPANKGQNALFNRSRFNYIKTMDEDLFRKIATSGTRPFPIRAKEIIASALNKGITMIEASNTGLTTFANFGEDKENIEYLITTT
jgi:hypothetical protein